MIAVREEQLPLVSLTVYIRRHNEAFSQGQSLHTPLHQFLTFILLKQ